jgi:hypothetical protein
MVARVGQRFEARPREGSARGGRAWTAEPGCRVGAVEAEGRWLSQGPRQRLVRTTWPHGSHCKHTHAGAVPWPTQARGPPGASRALQRAKAGGVFNNSACVACAPAFGAGAWPGQRGRPWPSAEGALGLMRASRAAAGPVRSRLRPRLRPWQASPRGCSVASVPAAVGRWNRVRGRPGNSGERWCSSSNTSRGNCGGSNSTAWGGRQTAAPARGTGARRASGNGETGRPRPRLSKSILSDPETSRCPTAWRGCRVRPGISR